MIFNINKKSFVVFDLDDTLYKEIDFLKSAYHKIAEILEPQIGHNIFDEMVQIYENKRSTLDVIKEKYTFKETVEQLVEIYRYHNPQIQLSEGAFDLLKSLHGNNLLGLITDGRKITQTNKIESLNIHHFFSEIVISEEFGSEKPSLNNFIHFQEKYPNHHFFYLADNLVKDFIAPNKLGWTTIGLLNDSRNIHSQIFEKLPELNKPQFWIRNFNSLKFQNS